MVADGQVSESDDDQLDTDARSIWIGNVGCSFWATVCKMVYPMLSDHCPVCRWRWCIVAKRLDGSRSNLAWR